MLLKSKVTDNKSKLNRQLSKKVKEHEVSFEGNGYVHNLECVERYIHKRFIYKY